MSVRTEVVAEGLSGPTQLAVGPDGQWFVAQLAGGENDGQGQVIAIGSDGNRRTVIDGLDKPTGVAVFADELWVMERDRLTRGPLDGTTRAVVAEDLANNGRSEGSLSVIDDRLLFDTSGSIAVPPDMHGTPQTASGMLWSVDGAGRISPVAGGFKHAYAQTIDTSGRLWTTEVADGSYDGVPAVDEVVLVTEGGDHGWPHCVDNHRVVDEFGGTDDACAQTPSSQALFPLGATPTSIVVAPWDPGQLVVALWGSGTVVTLSATPSSAPVDVALLSDVIARPQHLAVEGDAILVTDHEAGQVVRLSVEP